ncbi:MAG TPA: hypothetical protein PK455_05920 [Caldisericia bacterium]|nr:hypothetical protein [Caldisericia bacterium]
MKQLNIKKIIIISQKTNGRCFYCNKIGEAVDHFISKQKWIDWDLENTPLKGNLNKLDNLFLTCKKCNSKKKDKCPEDFFGNSYKIWSRYERANKRINNFIKKENEV